MAMTKMWGTAGPEASPGEVAPRAPSTTDVGVEDGDEDEDEDGAAQEIRVARRSAGGSRRITRPR
jgi:hypothetical protein